MTKFSPNAPNIFLQPDSNNFSNLPILVVMTYETIKGLLALVIGYWLLQWHEHLLTSSTFITFANRHVGGFWFASQLDKFINWLEMVNSNLFKAIWFILIYAMLRFIEVYGLYRDRAWAYWLSILGYGIFLPIELYYLFTPYFSELFLIIFIINLAIFIIIYNSMRYKKFI